MVKNKKEKQERKSAPLTWKRVMFNLLFQTLNAIVWLFVLPFLFIYMARHDSNFNIILLVFFLWFGVFSFLFTSISKRIMGWKKAILALFVRIICIFCFGKLLPFIAGYPVDNLILVKTIIFYGMIIVGVIISTECLFVKITNRFVKYLILFLLCLLIGAALTYKRECEDDLPCWPGCEVLRVSPVQIRCSTFIYGIRVSRYQFNKSDFIQSGSGYVLDK